MIVETKSKLDEKKLPDLSKLNMFGKFAKIESKGVTEVCVTKACATEAKDETELQKQEQHNFKFTKNGEVLLDKNEEQKPAVETGWLAGCKGWLNKMLKPSSSLSNTILAETKDKDQDPTGAGAGAGQVGGVRG